MKSLCFLLAHSINDIVFLPSASVFCMSTKLKAMPVPTVDLTDFIQDLLRQWIFPNNGTRLYSYIG